jgi:DNA-binding transcriptional ArsR family regulator
MLDVYGQLAEPSRRLILSELRTGPKSVSELVELTGLKQPNVSNHLAKMRSRGIVRANKLGRLVYYMLSTPDVHAAVVAVVGNPAVRRTSVKLDVLADEFASFAVNGDESRCNSIVDVAMRSGAEMLEVLGDLIGESLQLVAEQCHSGRIDGSEQRIALVTTERILTRLAQITAPRRQLFEVALLGGAQGFWQTARIRVFGEYLRAEGWRTLYLGPSAPEGAFVEATLRHQPRLVMIGCDGADSVAAAALVAERLSALDGRHQVCRAISGDGAAPDGNGGVNFAFSARNLREFAESCLPKIEPGAAEKDES